MASHRLQSQRLGTVTRTGSWISCPLTGKLQTILNAAPLAVAALLVGCAAAPPPLAKQQFPVDNLVTGKAGDTAAHGTRSGVSAADLADPEAYASRFRSPASCEEAARAAITVSRDHAWRVLLACVRRGRFTPLPRLLDGAWDADLRTRADASNLLLQMVAARGGDVERDLQLIGKRHLAIYPLSTAVAKPEAYRGRLVLLRASIQGVSAADGPPELRAIQLGSVQMMAGSWDKRRQFTSREYTATERQLIVRLPRPDPSLEAGLELVLLGRFDGLSAPTEVEDKLPVLTVLAHALPGAPHID